MIYTTNGSDYLREHKGYEEWFEVPATVNGGTATATAPPGMTHGVFYLRDENGFLVSSEPIPAMSVKGYDLGKQCSTFLEDGYAYRPDLVSLINCGIWAERNAEKMGQEIAALTKAIQAKAVVAQPVEEESYSIAMRNRRKEIRALDVPEAKLTVLNQFEAKEW